MHELMRIVVTHNRNLVLIDQRLQLYGEPQDPTAIFQVLNAQRCGIGQRDEELAFVHNMEIILRRAPIIKKRKISAEGTWP